MDVASHINMRLTALALACTAASTTALAQPRVIPNVFTDPAVFTFADFVEHRLRPPLSNDTIITGVDLLVSALEAVVIGQRLDDGLLDRAHRLRREVREVYQERATSDRISDRQELFEDVAELMADLNNKLPRQDQIAQPRIDALERSADAIERDDPLRQQPDVVERFFRHAAEALRVARP